MLDLKILPILPFSLILKKQNQSHSRQKCEKNLFDRYREHESENSFEQRTKIVKLKRRLWGLNLQTTYQQLGMLTIRGFRFQHKSGISVDRVVSAKNKVGNWTHKINHHWISNADPTLPICPCLPVSDCQTLLKSTPWAKYSKYMWFWGDEKIHSTLYNDCLWEKGSEAYKIKKTFVPK